MEKENSKILNVCITGAAGNIAYSFIPLLANGLVFGPDVKIDLRLLDIEEAQDKLKGTAMELEDCCYDLIEKVSIGSDADTLFKDADIVIFIGGAARKGNKGERKDLLKANGKIYKEQGEALSRSAKKTVKCLVVTNPANTLCLILQKNSKGIPPTNFSCLTHLDYSRTVANVALKHSLDNKHVKDVVVWGNHSKKCYPDLSFAKYKDQSLVEIIKDKSYIEHELIEAVRNRAFKVFELMDRNSTLSAANAIKKHLHHWYNGTNEWVIFGALSDGKNYGIPEGLYFSHPVTCEDFEYKAHQGLELSETTKKAIEENVKELQEEMEEAAEYL